MSGGLQASHGGLIEEKTILFNTLSISALSPYLYNCEEPKRKTFKFFFSKSRKKHTAFI
jgi:hypothetical protein